MKKITCFLLATSIMLSQFKLVNINAMTVGTEKSEIIQDELSNNQNFNEETKDNEAQNESVKTEEINIEDSVDSSVISYDTEKIMIQDHASDITLINMEEGIEEQSITPYFFDNATTIKFNEEISTEFEKGYYKSFKLKLPSASRLTIKLIANGSYELTIFNSDMEEVKYCNAHAYPSKPSSNSCIVDLEADTYYIKTTGNRWHILGGNEPHYGTLKMTYSKENADNQDIEPNNGTTQAQKIELNNSLNGFISATDKTDYYKIEVPKKGDLYFDLTTYGDLNFSLLDSNNKVIASYDGSRHLSGTWFSPNKKSFNVTVSSGIYYIKFTEYNSKYLAGKYTLKVSMPSFVDVVDHWALNYIEQFFNKGYINGYTDGTFRPDATITRAEFVKIVNNAFGKTQKAQTSFTDVTGWRADVAAIGVKAGYITNGKLFRPNDPITREEASKIVGIVAGIKGDGKLDFKDQNQISNWAKVYIDGLVDKGILSKKDNFRPKDNLRRGEAVKMLELASQK